MAAAFAQKAALAKLVLFQSEFQEVKGRHFKVVNSDGTLQTAQS
jgi:hypothetical protein